MTKFSIIKRLSAIILGGVRNGLVYSLYSNNDNTRY